MKKHSEPRDGEHATGALVRAGHHEAGAVSDAAAATAHQRSENACIEERDRVQVETNAAGTGPEGCVDALIHLMGGGDVVLALETDGHEPAVSLPAGHLAPT